MSESIGHRSLRGRCPKTALTISDEIRLLNKPKSMPFFMRIGNYLLSLQLSYLTKADILNLIRLRATKARGFPKNPFSFNAVVTDESAAGVDIPLYLFNKKFCYYFLPVIFQLLVCNDEQMRHSNLRMRNAGYDYRNGQSTQCCRKHPSWR